MNKITDEMLNDYLDNELDNSSVEELKNKLNEDEKSVKKLKALKIVDESLRDLEIYPAPSNFTEHIMNVILAGVKSIKPRMNYFFVSIMSVFALCIAGVFVLVANTEVKSDSTHSNVQIFEFVKKFVGEHAAPLISFLNNDKILLVGGILTIILILTGLFVFDSHKNFKEKLKGITH